MQFVYILQNDSGGFYVGVTENLDRRLAEHNAGAVIYTAKSRPWRIRTYIAFSEAERAHAFEKYLKSGSGRAFSTKRF